MKILSVKDRIKLKYKSEDSEIVVTVRPLKQSQKMEINSLQKNVAGETIDDHAAQAFLSVKYSIAAIDGLKTYSGDDYKLDFDDAGFLTDDCIEDLLPALQSISCLHHVLYSSNRLLENLKDVDFEIVPN